MSLLFGTDRWRVLAKPSVLVLTVLAVMFSIGAAFALRSTFGGRFVDAHFAAIDAASGQCSMSWKGPPEPVTGSTIPCPEGAELGPPVRIEVVTVGSVYPTRAHAVGTGWMFVGLAVVVVGVVGFALTTPNSDRCDVSVGDMFTGGD